MKQWESWIWGAGLASCLKAETVPKALEVFGVGEQKDCIIEVAA
jgi:hypothetical protein